jgi:hypothetical protein
MKNKEAIINRVYSTKNGETVISLKFKFDEILPSEEKALREAWREGTPLDVSIDEFQPEYIDTLPHEN